MIGRLSDLRRAEARRRATELVERFGLSDVAGRPARTYSGGLRRRLDVAASLVAGPPALFLDEPTTGLDPNSRLALWEEISRLRAQGTTLLLTTQYLEEADRLADRVAVIDGGRVLALGTPDELKTALGGSRLHIRTSQPDAASRAMQVLARIPGDHLEIRDGGLSLAVTHGTRTLAEAAGRLDAAGIEVADFAFGGPTLDEVFVALTRKGDKAAQFERTDQTPSGARESNVALEAEPGSEPADDGPLLGARDAVVMTKRNLLRYIRIPSLAVFSVVQPVMIVLLFTFAFGGAIRLSGIEYVDYLLPGSLIIALTFGASQTGIALAQDLSTGMIDRFRSLPMGRSAPLVGRTLAEGVRNLVGVSLMIAVGYLLGFRFQAGPIRAIAAIGLALAVGFALSWISAFIGLAVRDAETAQVASLLPLIALIFASSTFVPVRTMPDWLEVFARVNPITKAVDAMRALALGGPASRATWEVTAWVVGILGLFVPLAVLEYRRTTA